MKKLLTVLLAAMLLVTACSSNSSNKEGGSSNEASGGKKEITVWAWDKNFNIAAMETAKAIYAEKNPDLTVNVIENAQADIIQKLNAGLNSGTTKSLPNIVLIEDYRAQSFLQAYPEHFFPLDDFINPSDFADYKIGPTSYEGKQYAVPFDSGVAGLYVRTDYLEAAGFTTADLTNVTWDQYIEVAKTVKEKTGKNMLTLDPNDLGFVRLMAQSAGSWYMKEDGVTPDLADNLALKRSFEIFKQLLEADVVKVISDWSQFVGAFNSGDVASVPTGNWITASVKAEESQAGNWAILPLPSISGVEGAGHASNLGGSSWYVLNVDGKEAAADFMKETFGSSVELYEKLVTQIGAIGTLKAAADSDAYKVADEFFAGQHTISDFSAWTEQIIKVNYGMHTYAIEDIMIAQMQNYLNGTDIDTVMKDAQAQADAQLR